MIIGKDLRCSFGLGFDDGEAGVWQVAPDIVADFLSRIFHIAHKNALSFTIEVIPTNFADFFLASRRKERKRYDVLHRDALFALFRFLDEVVDQGIQFIKGRAALTTLGLAGKAQSLGNGHGVSMGLLVELQALGWFGDGEFGPQMRQSISEERMEAMSYSFLIVFKTCVLVRPIAC